MTTNAVDEVEMAKEAALEVKPPSGRDQAVTATDPPKTPKRRRSLAESPKTPSKHPRSSCKGVDPTTSARLRFIPYRNGTEGCKNCLVVKDVQAFEQAQGACRVQFVYDGPIGIVANTGRTDKDKDARARHWSLYLDGELVGPAEPNAAFRVFKAVGANNDALTEGMRGQQLMDELRESAMEELMRADKYAQLDSDEVEDKLRKYERAMRAVYDMFVSPPDADGVRKPPSASFLSQGKAGRGVFLTHDDVVGGAIFAKGYSLNKVQGVILGIQTCTCRVNRNDEAADPDGQDQEE